MERVATQKFVSSVLRAMAWSFRLNPGFHRNLIIPEEFGGSRYLEATFLLRTRDDGVRIGVEFKEGKMKVKNKLNTEPDLTFIFKTPYHMRFLFAVNNPADPLLMMLEQNLEVEGNLIYLAWFGHVSKELTMGKKKRNKLRRSYLYENGFRTRREQNGESKESLEEIASRKPFSRGTLRSKPHDAVEVLNEPYLSDYSLEDFPRLYKAREKLYQTPAEVCTERAFLLTEYFKEEGFFRDRDGKSRNPALRQAEALRYVLANRSPIIRSDDLLAGTTTSKEVGVLLFPEFGAATMWPELLTIDERNLNPYRINVEDIELLNNEVFPFWMDKNIMEYTRSRNDNPQCQQYDEKWVFYFSWKPYAVSHTIPDFPSILKRGLRSIIEEAAEKEKASAEAGEEDKKNFYKAMQIANQGVIKYAENLAAEAERQLQAGRSNGMSPARKEELEAMSRVCRQVPEHPARNLQEAINSIWICWVALHMENMNAGLSLGLLDRWLQPYFMAEIQQAQTEAERQRVVEKALELVGSFYLKCSDHLPLVPDIANRLFGGSSSDQALTLGGVDQNGHSAVSDMTYIFLKATEVLSLREPNMNARFHPEVNSWDYLHRLVEVNTITTATPSLHNDKAVLAAVENQGFSPADAREWGATGCVEPTSCGRHMGHTNCMLLNTVAPLEMALNNGVHPLNGQKIGPSTGDPRHGSAFPTFEDFKEAYKQQLACLIENSIAYNNMLGESHQHLHPTPLLSAFFRGPMEKGRDVIDGGAMYNTSGAALVSITDVIDSLAAIKKLIYEENITDWPALLEAVENDFEGWESLHQYIMRRIPKFGTGEPQTQELAQELIDFIYHRYQSYNNYRGGPYTSGFWSMSNHVAFGSLSGALPSGRKKGKAFTPGITPAPGASEDLLPSIHSIAGLDPLKMPNNIAFNVKVGPGARDSHREYVERVAAYAGTYFQMGGMQMQFNMVTSETLREAMENPEDYRWLLVRISGYNAYFVELNREMQEELIERTEH